MISLRKKHSIVIKFKGENNGYEADNPCQLTKGILNLLLMVHSYLICVTLLSFKFKTDFRPFIAFKRTTIKQMESEKQLLYAGSVEPDVFKWNLRYVRQASTTAIENYERILTISLITSALYCALWSLYVVSKLCGWVQSKPMLVHCLYTAAKLSFNVFAVLIGFISYIVLSDRIQSELLFVLRQIAPLNKQEFTKIESIFHCVGNFRTNAKANGTWEEIQKTKRQSWPICEESIPMRLPAVWILIAILSTLMLIWLFDLLLMYSSFLSEPISETNNHPTDFKAAQSSSANDMIPLDIESSETASEEFNKSTEETREAGEIEQLMGEKSTPKVRFENDIV